MDKKYREYFAIDEGYFPQINDSSIAADPNFWTKTYPHETFVRMLSAMERVLSRQERRSLWIEGAYGTGKSQCAYALKKILDVPEIELREYWQKYELLKKETDLLEKMLGHKDKGIVTAYRYASGNISSPRELFLAIQESIKKALVERNLYTGENTLKESVIAWIDDPARKRFFNELLQKPEWAIFSQRTADEVLHELQNGSELTELMGNIFNLAEKEGITALNIDAERLLTWLKDVIDTNEVKIVLIWDEFSAYFKRNKDSLDEFQKIVELVNLKPFYLIIVTHESGQLFSENDKTWKVVSDRFVSVPITLPDNIAFNLISHAFNVKEAGKDEWNILASDLNQRVYDSRLAVMKVAKITNENVMTNIMPMHPMAALLLKNISSSFKSNQRSMFDFIKSSTVEDVKSFQWFIDNSSPMDDFPLLTVDMLWDFFYEKGKENLTPDIRLILDVFPQQHGLSDKEKIVLKAILIMQAIDKRMAGVMDIFKATEQNLSYAFEGIPDLESTACIGIAKSLVKQGILVSAKTSNNKNAFVAAVLAGDQGKIEDNKKKIRETSTTSRLVAEGELASVLLLSPALRVRYESEPGTGKIVAVTHSDFTRIINILSEKNLGWKFPAVIAFAKDDLEASAFRQTLKAAVRDSKYRSIIFIDALSSPLGHDAFEQYVEHAAMAQYYAGSNNSTARDSADKAKYVLTQDWKNRIYNGQFTIYNFEHQDGEKLSNAQGVSSFMQTIVLKKFPHVFDFARGLSENTLKLTQAKQSARCGLVRKSQGAVVGIEKHTVFDVWSVENYWQHVDYKLHPISKIKNQILQIIEKAFIKEGQISIGEIYDFLEKEFGFSQCNLSAFLTGFLLREYSDDPYRYSDSSGGHEPMTAEKLAEMIGNYIGKTPKTTYILKKTHEEMSFYQVTEKAWGIAENSCSSASQAASAVARKMRNLGLPVWCLSEVDSSNVYGIVNKYIELVQSEGAGAHKKALEIGKAALVRADLANFLSSLLTAENCQKGMREFLLSFEGGKLPLLAKEIGAEDCILSDIRRLFSVQHSCLWNREISENEIRKLIIEYELIKILNKLLHGSSNSLQNACNILAEKIKFLGISSESLQLTFPNLKKVFSFFSKISQDHDILFEQQKEALTEIEYHYSNVYEIFENGKNIFSSTYSIYLEDLSENDIDEIKAKLPSGMFNLSATISNAKVKEAVLEFRKKQLRTELFYLWKKKTDTKNPKEWSSKYRTPILCCVPENDYEAAKKAFETINNSWAPDDAINMALNFVKESYFFEEISEKKFRDYQFTKNIIGEYATLLHDLEKVRDALELLNVSAYDWKGNPSVEKKIRLLAEAEYNSGGSDEALLKIDTMDDAQLKQYLKRLVKQNMAVGIEIISDRKVGDNE